MTPKSRTSFMDVPFSFINMCIRVGHTFKKIYISSKDSTNLKKKKSLLKVNTITAIFFFNFYFFSIPKLVIFLINREKNKLLVTT